MLYVLRLHITFAKTTHGFTVFCINEHIIHTVTVQYMYRRKVWWCSKKNVWDYLNSTRHMQTVRWVSKFGRLQEVKVRHKFGCIVKQCNCRERFCKHWISATLLLYNFGDPNRLKIPKKDFNRHCSSLMCFERLNAVVEFQFGAYYNILNNYLCWLHEH